MNIENRDDYSFIGMRANDSVKYYDTVVSNGYSGSKDYLAWDAAHKFGTRMTGIGVSSFRSGITIGAQSLAAAEYIDEEYRIAYSSCEEHGRSKKMKTIMQAVYARAKQLYDVEIELL